jgi:RNA polymerase sigma-70 factor (ECF subfamily)
MPDSDIELMLRIQVGDESAFRELFERYAASLINFFYWYGHTTEDAEDATQDVFQRIWQARDQYQPTGKFRSYLYRIATNHVIDSARTRKRRPGVVSLDATLDADDARSSSLMDRLPGSASTPDSVLERRETASRVEDAVARLPEAQRVVFLLGVRENIKYREIAGILGIPEGTVRFLLKGGGGVHSSGPANRKTPVLKDHEHGSSS